MALVDSINASTRKLSMLVQINGVPLYPTNPTLATGVPAIETLNVRKSLDAPVPVATIGLSRVPTWMRRGQSCLIDLGYDGFLQRVFTGTVQDRSHSVGTGQVIAAGTLYSLFRTIQIPEQDVDGMTVRAAILSLLDYTGITLRSVDDLGTEEFTLGSASSPTLERMATSQMLQMLMDLDGRRVWEQGDGRAIVRVLEEQPAPVSYLTYTTTTNASARILDGSDREDPDYLRTRMTVTGATIVEAA